MLKVIEPPIRTSRWRAIRVMAKREENKYDSPPKDSSWAALLLNFKLAASFFVLFLFLLSRRLWWHHLCPSLSELHHRPPWNTAVYGNQFRLPAHLPFSFSKRKTPRQWNEFGKTEKNEFFFVVLFKFKKGVFRKMREGGNACSRTVIFFFDFSFLVWFYIKQFGFTSMEK